MFGELQSNTLNVSIPSEKTTLSLSNSFHFSELGYYIHSNGDFEAAIKLLCVQYISPIRPYKISQNCDSINHYVPTIMNYLNIRKFSI